MNQTKKTFLLSEHPKANIFLILIWGMSGIILSLPMANDWSWMQKAFYLFLPGIFTLIGTLTRPKDGFAIWAFVLTFLISQTGFQLQIGSITTSALELCIVVLLGILLLVNRTGKHHLVHLRDLPGYKWLFAFILYSSMLFVLGIVRGDSIFNAIIQFKGFLLYPLMIYLMLSGIRSERALFNIVLFMALWFMFIGGHAILDFLNPQSVPLFGNAVYRASGAYAPINIFGSSVVAMALILLGISISSGRALWRGWLLRGISVFLIMVALTSVSRGALIALAVGALALVWLSKKRGLMVGGVILIAALIIFLYLPPILLESSVERIFQISDSSTMKRLFFIESGVRAFLKYWPVGAGWGNAFWYYESVGLIPTGFIPWYHNDYLDLAVQVGLPGLLLYTGFWLSVLRALWKWLQDSTKTVIGRPFVVGGMAALIAVLIGALFEHFLWRTDMGGLVTWVASLAVIGTRLISYEKEVDDTNHLL